MTCGELNKLRSLCAPATPLFAQQKAEGVGAQGESSGYAPGWIEIQKGIHYVN